MKTYPIWPFNLWFQFLSYPRRDVPLTERGSTQESQYPWRIGRCRIFRIPGTRRAISIGWWTGYQPRENVEGTPTLSLRPLDHPEDYFHVQEDRPRND